MQDEEHNSCNLKVSLCFLFKALCTQHHVWPSHGRVFEEVSRPRPVLWWDLMIKQSLLLYCCAAQYWDSVNVADMHMMVSRPEQWVKPMAAAGANQYTFHLEATTNPGNLIKEIRESGMKVRKRLQKKRQTCFTYSLPWRKRHLHNYSVTV